MSKVRVRFAPSPTGPLHLGGVRTALYDYLFAKNQGGDFVLRIEDTDTARYVEGAEEYIMKALEWCGIIPDESPIHGGNYGPYRQSERRDIYDKYTAEILKTDYAYIAFDTPEELEKVRAEYEAKGEVFSYNNFTRNSMRNSLTLSEQETQELINQNVPYVVRFKMPIDRIVNLEDIIRGKSSVNTNTLDDKVLVKNDGMPTYHFANIIDDHEMEITHVIRGEEWLPSMPLHVLLYEAMGWTAPEFAHLSLILKSEGKGKLSKRDGDQHGFPVFPLQWKDPQTGEVSKGFREEGYLPEAVINFLALLGWNPGTEQEMMSLDELSLEPQMGMIEDYYKFKIKARIMDNLEKIAGQDYDKNRFEQEMIYYIEKLDVNEEKNRLDNHLKYYISTMESGHGQGKKLGFIAQEMGREINTLGSKSNHAEMQKLVVQMKDELEQIKEQVLNVL